MSTPAKLFSFFFVRNGRKQNSALVVQNRRHICLYRHNVNNNAWRARYLFPWAQSAAWQREPKLQKQQPSEKKQPGGGCEVKCSLFISSLGGRRVWTSSPKWLFFLCKFLLFRVCYKMSSEKSFDVNWWLAYFSVHSLTVPSKHRSGRLPRVGRNWPRFFKNVCQPAQVRAGCSVEWCLMQKVRLTRSSSNRVHRVQGHFGPLSSRCVVLVLTSNFERCA